MVEEFSEEAAYYSRWKDFKSKADDDTAPEVDDDELLMEELALVSANKNSDPKLMASRFLVLSLNDFSYLYMTKINLSN